MQESLRRPTNWADSEVHGALKRRLSSRWPRGGRAPAPLSRGQRYTLIWLPVPAETDSIGVESHVVLSSRLGRSHSPPVTSSGESGTRLVRVVCINEGEVPPSRRTTVGCGNGSTLQRYPSNRFCASATATEIKCGWPRFRRRPKIAHKRRTVVGIHLCPRRRWNFALPPRRPAEGNVELGKNRDCPTDEAVHTGGF